VLVDVDEILELFSRDRKVLLCVVDWWWFETFYDYKIVI